MRKKIGIIITIIICFLLQTTVFQTFSFASISPNLLVIIVSTFGFMYGKKEGMFVGFICGILMDLFFGSVLGFYAILLMYIGFVNGIFKKIFYPEDMKLPMILIAGSDFVYGLIVYAMQFFFRSRFNFGYYFLHIIMPELVYTLIVAIVLYFILLKVGQRIERLEKRSGR